MSETNSVASSQRTITSTRSRLGVRLFTTSIPLFPVFLALESKYHKVWAYAGVLVQFVQFLGFVLNPHLQHGETLYYVSYAAYSTHLPFWDPKWIDMSWIGYIMLWLLGVLFITLFSAYLVYIVVTKSPPMRSSKSFVLLRLCLHSASTIFFIPLCQGFLSQMVCVDDHLWTFEDKKCFTGSTTPVFIVSMLALIVLGCLTFLVETTLFVEGYSSPHPLARKHYVNDIFMITWKILTLVLFHLFLSNSGGDRIKYYWVPMYVAMSSGIMVFTYTFFLPFIHQRMNRIFTIIFLIECVAGVVVFFSSEASIQRRSAASHDKSMLADVDADGFLLIVFSAVMVVVGWLLGDIRINKELLESLPQVTDAAAPFPKQYSLLYPKGLPEYDVAYQSTVDVCNEIADGAMTEGRSPVSLEIPFLRHIYFYTDVEVSTRFIPMLEKITGHYPTKEMLHLATRIYIKGLYRFSDSVALLVSFAAMISEYTSKPSLALIQCERTNVIAASLPSRYRSYRLLGHLKKQLRLRDAAYQHQCEEAKRAHKEVLIRLHQFWHKLASQHDHHQLEVTFSIIAHRRKETNEMFLAALQQNSDRELFLKYADFLEQIMIEPSVADKLRHSVLEEVEKQSNATTNIHTDTSRSAYADLVKKHRGKSSSASTLCGLHIDLHTFWKMLTAVLLFVTAGAFLAVAIIAYNWQKATLKCVEYGSSARTLRIQGDMVAAQFWTTQELFEDSGTRLNAISAISQDMLYIHDFLTGGLPRSSTSTRNDFFTNQLVITSHYSGATIRYDSTSFLSLGFQYATHLNDMAGVIARGNLKATTIKQIFTEVTAAKASLFDANGRLWGANAYNFSVQACKTWHNSVERSVVLVLCLLYAISLFLIAILLQLSIMANPVEKLKNTIITLVTLIPHHKIKEISERAKKRIEMFDSTQGGDEEMFQLQEVEAAQADRAEAEAREDGDGEALNNDDADGETKEKGSDDDSSPPEKQQLLSRNDRDNANKAAKKVDDTEETIESSEIHLTRASSSPTASLVLYTIVILLLFAAVVISVLSIPESKTKLATINVAERVILYVQAETNVLYAAYEMCSYFFTGLEDTYADIFQAWDLFRRSFAGVLSYKPSQDEAVELVSIANSIYEAETLMSYLTTFHGALSSVTSQWDSTTSTVPTNTVGETARLNMFSISSSSLSFLIAAIVNSTSYASTTAAALRTDCLNEGDRKKLVVAVCSCTAIAAAVMICLIFVLLSQFGWAKKRQILLVLIVAAFCCSLASIFSGVTYAKLNGIQNICWRYVKEQEEQSLGIRNCISPLIYASAFAELGADANLILALDYFHFIYSNSYQTYINSLSGTDKTTFVTAVEKIRFFEKIAVSMVTEVLGASLPELADFTWDFDAESDAMTVRVEYPDDPLRYTTTATDFALSTVELAMKAKDVLSTARTQDYIDDMYNVIINHFHSQRSEYHSSADSEALRIQIFNFLSIGFLGVSTVAFIAFLFFELRMRLAEVHDRSSKHSYRRIYGVNRLRFLLIGLALLSTASFVMSIYVRSYRSSLVDQIDLMNERGFYVAYSMISVEMWAGGSNPVPLLRSSIDFYYARLDYIRMKLSYGKTNVFNTYPELDTFLLGSNVELSERFRYGFNYVSALDSTTNGSSYVFTNGVENALGTWMQQILEVSYFPYYTSSITLLQTLRESVMQLLRGLDEACYILFDSATSKDERLLAVEIVLISLFMLLVLLTFPIYLIPEAQYNSIEEAGYRMLVQIIPDDVKERIPAMRSFIANGLDKQTDMSTSTDEIGIPTIAITTAGIVTHFNRAAEEAFGFAAAEVLGNNVSILMPARIAKVHQTFLEKYEKEKPINRQIFRDKEMHGRRKNNEHFAMRLSVNEVRLKDGSRSFIGFALDISHTVEQTRSELLNRFVQEHMTLPMIAIDSLGSVLRFNRAAEECFGRTAAEVLDTNVKILMPEEIASRHDTYLATYLRTKQKKAIGNITRSRAIRKSGVEFPIELIIKEIVTDNVSTYVGFGRDLSGDQQLEMDIAISEAILKTSVTPIICTDLYGRIVSFSKAAERTFGYTASEVLDHNCKVLMPETVADRHDEFMENYRMSWTKRASSIVDRSIVGRHKDGHIIPLFASLHEVKTSSANNSALVGFFRELAETQDLESSLSIEQIAAENHRTPIIVANNKGIILRANRATMLEFGFTSDELIGSNLSILMPPDVAEKHDSYLTRYLETGVGGLINNSKRMQAKRKNNTFFTAEIRVREVRNDDGDSTYVGYVRNIEKEVRMQRQEAINDIILSHSNMPLVAVDSTGKVMACNDSAERLLHYRTGELVGENIEAFLPNPAAANGNSAGFNLPVDQVVMCDAITFDATPIAVKATVKVVHTKPPYYLVLIHDTREDNVVMLKTTRNALIGETSPIPMIEFDAIGNIMSFNSAAEKQLLWRREEAIGKHIQCFLKDNEVLSDILKAKDEREASSELSSSRVYQTQAKTKNGRVYPVELAVREVEIVQSVEKHTKLYVAYITDLNEGMQQQAAQHASKTQLDLNPLAVVTINKFGMILTCNIAVSVMFGYTTRQLIGQNISSLMPDDIGKLHEGYLIAYTKTHIKNRIGRTTTVQGKRSNGSLFSLKLSVHELRDESATEETTFIGTMIDQSVELQLEDAKRFSLGLLSISSQPLIAFKSNGTMLAANDVACGIFVYDDENSLLRVPLKRVMPSFCGDNGEVLPRYLKGTAAQKQMMSARRSDGVVFDADVVFSTLSCKGVVAVVACLTDMTKTNRLLSQKKMNMTIADHCPLPVLIINVDGAIKFFSAAAEVFFNYKSDEAVGSKFQQLLSVEDVPRYEEQVETYLETGESSILDTRTERLVRLKSGELVPVNVVIKTIPPPFGVQQDFVVYIMDRRDEFRLENASNLAQAIETSMPLPFIITSNVGVVLDMNAAAEQFFTYKKKDLLGENISITISAPLPKELSEPFILRSSSTISRYGEVRKADVSVCPIEDYAHRNSSLTRFGWSFDDCTGANDLCRAKQRSERLMSFLKEAVLSVNPKTGKIVAVNAYALKTLHCDAPLLIDQPLSLVIPDNEKVQRILRVTPKEESHLDLSNGTESSMPCDIRTLTGSLFSAAVDVQCYSEEMLIHIKDAGELQFASMSRALVSSLEHLVLDPFLIVNEVDDIVFFSSSAGKVLGYETEDTIPSQSLVNGGFTALFDSCSNKRPGTVNADISSLSPFAVALSDESMGMRVNVVSAADEEHNFSTLRGQMKVVHAALDSNVSIALSSGRHRHFKLGFTELSPTIKDSKRRYVLVYLCNEGEKEEKNTMEISACLMENNPSAVLIIDAIGTLVKVNAAAEKMFRFERNQLVGKNVSLLMPQRHSTRHETYMQQYLRTKNRRIIGTTREIVAERKDGEQFNVAISVAEVEDEGQSVMYVGVMEEINPPE